jgi:hypothetical protein
MDSPVLFAEDAFAADVEIDCVRVEESFGRDDHYVWRVAIIENIQDGFIVKGRAKR